MSNDNTAKPTAGPWARNKYGTICSDAAGHNSILCADIAIPCGSHDLRSEAVANSELLLQAGNVYHETGLTPRQLAEQRDVLLESLKNLVGVIWPSPPSQQPHQTVATRVIKKNSKPAPSSPKWRPSHE